MLIISIVSANTLETLSWQIITKMYGCFIIVDDEYKNYISDSDSSKVKVKRTLGTIEEGRAMIYSYKLIWD